MRMIAWKGWPNCIELLTDHLRLIITTDVGPRIMFLGLPDGNNVLKEFEADLGHTGGTRWRLYGGHRLWHAPESLQRTYVPDNDPVEHASSGANHVRVTQRVEASTGIQKEMEITLSGLRARIVHRLRNCNSWPVELAPWALTAMAPGGRLIVPQEPHRPHPDSLQPVRPLVLWSYTDMADSRYHWGSRFITLRHDPAVHHPTKFGVRNTQEWAAYALNGLVFLKFNRLHPRAVHPDFNCNQEFFANDAMLELETLGPIAHLTENGGFTEHEEDWFLLPGSLGESDEAIEAAMRPLLDTAAHAFTSTS